ncbi:MAG: ABC transporter substrate-binding protein [Actinomycetota bacterium]|nr:ABC transporter substrate-binding protein [Actinomycetota bacterium]
MILRTHTHTRTRTRRTTVVVLISLAVVAGACSKSTSSTTTGTTVAGSATTTGGGKTGGTLVFGASADPTSMDGAYVSDGESFRAISQLFETLVTTKPGSTDIIPSLAKTWSASSDGLTWTFNLQSGVTFHDGTAFNGAAVCANFERWYHFKGVQQSPSISYYWSTVFGGFATQDDKTVPATSLYKSCSAPDAGTAIITLTERSSSFLAGLAVPAFSIASPDALTKYGADKVSGTGDQPKFDGDFGTQHPIGTGPFKFLSYTPNDNVTMVRNDNYWGPKAKLDKLILKTISNGAARRQALESGEIQGYDNVDPADLSSLSGGFQILQRPAFNVGYVGFNQMKPPLDNLKIRQAIAYALNRPALVSAKYPTGADVAKEFMPPQLFGYAADVTTYDYNLQKAKDLIASSGVANPTLEFWYPTNISRQYMPDPTANFQAFQADLSAAGFKVVPKSAPWKPDYVRAVNAGDAQLYLFGWTGDFGDPDNFVGSFFRTPQPAWGFNNQQIFDALNKARGETDQATRVTDYQAANKLIMDFLPGVPYVHTKPALAFTKNIKGFVPSVVANDVFAPVSVG